MKAGIKNPMAKHVDTSVLAVSLLNLQQNYSNYSTCMDHKQNYNFSSKLLFDPWSRTALPWEANKQSPSSLPPPPKKLLARNVVLLFKSLL